MNAKLLKRVKRRDTLARWVITAGGFAVIFVVIFILVLIARVALPLFSAPEASVFARFKVSDAASAASLTLVGVDEYLENAYAVDDNGAISFYEVVSGSLQQRLELSPPTQGSHVSAIFDNHDGSIAVQWSDGALSLEAVRFRPQFDAEGNRRIRFGVERLAEFAEGLDLLPVRELARASDERALRVSQMDAHRVQLLLRGVSRDIFGNEQSSLSRFELHSSSPISALALDSRGRDLYAGTRDGFLLHWRIDEDEARLVERTQAFDDGRAVTALAVLVGDVSLAVGDERGGLGTWFRAATPASGEEPRLRLIHPLRAHDEAVVAIVPSRRDKSLLSRSSSGILHYDHMTSERHLLQIAALTPLRLSALAARNNGLAALDESGNLTVWSIRNPHPEVSLRTLFGKVWYETYDGPAYVWQSSSASDDFEPKMSLVPLIFGTLKGTFYAMLLAVPLALLGAVYTSCFARPRFREMIKPTVEVMAAIPSVVIGFLAALWFAPRLEANLVSFFLSLAFVPTFLLLGVFAWQGLRVYTPLQRVERGFEFLSLIPLLLLALAGAFAVGPLLEQWMFGGDFRQFLFQEAGVRYDPRNSIVISFALGFAVIPIIFTIAEDSLSNVPPSLKAASLAMGASRWQTAWRVVLPSASPGIFAAVMIGLGRAIGETMIVLMATGNTAIMDWSMFNGMRPLSSNIAVEIPEAPVGGTLYRVLFFSAVLLFAMTFVLNTVAEVVRQRLRRKYGQF